MKIIAVTSPATDAGKTFIASGLAEAGTIRGIKTLFIDFESPIGDAKRVFGIMSNQSYPTVTSWTIFNDPWGDCLRSSSGTYVLPKPERLDEVITSDSVNRLLETAEKLFELVICDLGTDFGAQYWATLIEKANLSLLVSDCDEKALVRIQEFLNKLVIAPKNKWVLLVNNRESKGYYTPQQMARNLGQNEAIGEITEIPHFKNIQNGYPKTFSPDTVFAQSILDQVLGEHTSSKRPKRLKRAEHEQQLHLSSRSEKTTTNIKGNKKVNLIILDRITSFSGYKGYMVDSVGELSKQIESSKPIWGADWRLGINARPLRINSVYLYAQTDFLGSLDELDQIRFIEFVETLLEKKKPVYIIDSGRWREELLRLGAGIVEGGL